MRLFYILSLLFSFYFSIAQEVPNFQAVDSLYREDQFYFGTSYNLFSEKPSGVSQNSFSVGLTAGFLRDFPIHKNRTFAIAPGFGFSYHNYKQNLVISNKNNTIDYDLFATGAIVDKNKLSLLTLDVPLEIRWRNSTFESHKFWRVYSGVKWSYVLYNRSRYIANDGNYTVINNPNINKMQYGVYTTVGYNTWNLYAYYGISDMFQKNVLNSPKNFKTLSIGLMFYIL